MLAQARCWEESQGREPELDVLPASWSADDCFLLPSRAGEPANLLSSQSPAQSHWPGLGASLENRLIPGTARNAAPRQWEHESHCSLPSLCQWLANAGLQEWQDAQDGCRGMPWVAVWQREGVSFLWLPPQSWHDIQQQRHNTALSTPFLVMLLCTCTATEDTPASPLNKKEKCTVRVSRKDCTRRVMG